MLDLGDVDCLAQVTLNGRTLDPVWKKPYRVNVTDAVVAGENKLQIEVQK